MKNPRTWKERFAACVPKGICAACGKQPIDPKSKSRCRACLDRARAKAKTLRDARIKVGLCAHCGRGKPIGGLDCIGCQRKRSKTYRSLEGIG